MQTAQEFRELRKASGMSQIALARKSGIPRWKIAHFELGIAKMAAEEYERLLTVLVQLASSNAEVTRKGLRHLQRARRGQ
jgi:transcriptional regulator with XRE-family HTH domain